MKPTSSNARDPRSGVALILVLGLLAMLTILCVAFAISMRVERIAARAFADNTRAEQLISIAMVRSMEQVQEEMRNPVPKAYPDFAESSGTASPAHDAVGSKGDDSYSVPDLRAGEALDFIPDALLDDVDKLYRTTGAEPHWITEGITNGRVAYFIVNVSGLLDVNLAGSTNERVFSEHVTELDLYGLPDLADLGTFLRDREAHRRYESTPEIRQLNRGLSIVSNFLYYSYDANRDQVFSNPAGPAGVDLSRPPATLGLRNAAITNKFDLNAITNYPAYWTPGDYDGYRSDASFMSYYFNPLKAILTAAGMERPDDVGWNIVNYLDPDRVPQGGVTPNYPWRHTEGGEAIPLVNEIVLDFHPDSTPQTNMYQFKVELWYPFVPLEVKPSDEFYLHVSVFRDPDLSRLHGGAANELNIQSFEFAPWSFEHEISSMVYGTTSEFVVVKGPPMPISAGGTLGDANNTIRMLARVMKRDGSYVNPVDEAPGYEQISRAPNVGSPESDGYHKRQLFSWKQPQSMQVNDPRANGQIKYWTNAGDFDAAWNNVAGLTVPPANNTLGATNTNCRPWGDKLQGVPIYAKNGIMRNIGELGHIYRSNLDDEEPIPIAYWRTIELMKQLEGAILLDVIDVHEGGRPAFGLVSINTRQKGVLRSLFNNLSIGNDAIPGAGSYRIPDGKIETLVNEIIAYAASRPTGRRHYLSFADLFTDDDTGGPLAIAFRDCAPEGANSNDIYKEDTFRHIAELITFRQNIFMVVAVAQALAQNGETVLSEKRAVATIYRDSYTGRHFTRSFKWLND